MADSVLQRRFRELSAPLEPIETDAKPLLKKIPNIRVIAYDFYGTLFISGVGDIGVDNGKSDPAVMLDALSNSGIEILHDDAGSAGFNTYNQVVEKEILQLKKEGIAFPEPDIRQVWKQVLRKMAAQKLIRFREEKTESTAERISVEFEARMNPVWPMPDAAETLSWFKKNGFLQGIISNSQFYTPVILEALTGQSLNNLGFSNTLLHWSFQEKRKKPDLIFYETYLHKLRKKDPSLKPENILYTGNDMLKDIWPAQKTGMKTALFAGDQRSLKWRNEDERCKGLAPDLVITSLKQLMGCV